MDLIIENILKINLHKIILLSERKNMNDIARNFQNVDNVREIFNNNSKIREIFFNSSGGLTIFYKVKGIKSDFMMIVDKNNIDEWIAKNGEFIIEKSSKDLRIK